MSLLVLEQANLAFGGREILGNASLALTHRHRAGLFDSGPSRLFVTTGVGSWFPLRVNCPPEIAIITMQHAPEAAEVEPDAGSRRGRRKRRKRGRGRRMPAG